MFESLGNLWVDRENFQEWNLFVEPWEPEPFSET